MRTANANRNWRGRAALTAVLICSATLLVVSCAEKKAKWEPYVEPLDRVLVHGDERVDFSAQTPEQIHARSAGCITCHTGVHEPHSSTQPISCVDCHGGDGLADSKEHAHPHPKHPEWWPESGANPERSYVNLIKESWDWVRFVNPGDLRIANVTCGPCHPDHVVNVQKSVMATASHFWGVAGYANGIVSSKRTVFGESYGPKGHLQMVKGLIRDTESGEWREPTEEEIVEHSLAPYLIPLPHWEITQPGNVLRTFEKGSRLGGAALGFNGLPTPLPGIPDKLEDPGQPNNRLSDRGLGTLNRVDLPILNVQKTRLNDPHMGMMGTNDQPGDYRSSGCTGCHVVYANDRMTTHSGPYAKFGNMGHTRPDNPDPTIAKGEPGHPLAHEFTSSIPSSQCMVCHHHQPNSFVNSYYGFQMWTYETDGEHFFPEEPIKQPTEEWVAGLVRNPEEAARRGLWGEVEWLKDSAVRVNPVAKHTQFADYHGHGWMFRAVFKMDRKGNLLDKTGNVIPYDDPEKFKGVIPIEGVPGDHHKPAPAHARRAVHMKDIHAEYGMHCVDCHFTNDVHGDGNIFAEYQAAVEIKCEDCHGTINERADVAKGFTGPAATAPGHFKIGLGDLRTPWKEDQFFTNAAGDLVQRSMIYPDKSWVVSQVKDSVTPGNPNYSRKAAYYKTIQKDNRTWGGVPSDASTLAHAVSPEGGGNGMECYTCHTSWITSCFGCHLPQRADLKTPVNHFEKKSLRNYATYNPQVARDSEFMLGVAGNVKDNRISPVRSSSAVLISSEDGQRRRIYGAIPTMAANGMSSQVFNTHFAHTVRKTETRECADCHVSEADDNNAWMAQVMLLGTNAVNYMGHYAYVGSWGRVQAVQVTEWGEPQAVLGSNLHRLAYPDEYREFVDGGRKLDTSYDHYAYVRSLQQRGEYLYAAEGADGITVYDIANVGNKDFSDRLITAPVSPLGQDISIDTRHATAIALPTNNLISMARQWRPENHEQPYEYRGKRQNLHESYRYAYVSDRHEGLIVIDVDCLSDGDPQNNFIKRAATFNPGGVLDGAENLTVAGTTVYVCCNRGVVAVDISDPLAPRVIAEVGGSDVVRPRAIAVQFRYAFVCDAQGVKVLDVTVPEQMRAVPGATVNIPDARDIYVAKTYGYVSAGAEGLVILDLETASRPKVDQIFNADGAIGDLNQVKVAMTNASLYAYLADGHNGFHVLQLVTPEDGGRSAYGFSPRPRPKLIASFDTAGPAMAISKGLDRDRAVDESGHQVAAFGRIGGRPMNLDEMRRLFLQNGRLYKVRNEPPATTGNASAEIDNRGH